MRKLSIILAFNCNSIGKKSCISFIEEMDIEKIALVDITNLKF